MLVGSVLDDRRLSEQHRDAPDQAQPYAAQYGAVGQMKVPVSWQRSQTGLEGSTVVH